MQKVVALALALGALLCVSAQPFAPGTGFLPAGNLRTSDRNGPYNLTLLSTQVNEIKGAIAARQDFTDKDLINFLTNVECLEGLFDTWGTFGHGFIGDLELGGPRPIGAKKANLSPEVEQYLQEVALNEQGHALFTRQAGGANPCPLVDFTGGFNKFFAAAYGLKGEAGLKAKFGRAFDPFENDETFTTSMLSLEELGATGNKGLAGLASNPVISTGIAGLATSATAQATIQRVLLWERRNNLVPPFKETVQQVFSRISALRDSLDGPQFDDQGLTNTDPRGIAVPDGYINLIPTDVRGITFNRAPQMLINILTLGNPEGKGVFFPNGLHGKINKPIGYAKMASGLETFPNKVASVGQETVAQVGKILPPLSDAYNPPLVEGSLQLTQHLGGPIQTSSYKTRGFTNIPVTNKYGSKSGPKVQVAINHGRLSAPGLQYRVCENVSKMTDAKVLKHNEKKAIKNGKLKKPAARR